MVDTKGTHTCVYCCFPALLGFVLDLVKHKPILNHIFELHQNHLQEARKVFVSHSVLLYRGNGMICFRSDSNFKFPSVLCKNESDDSWVLLVG